jgi:nicotinate-nucleotide--dimethylbenzimidazole phosphoribosyltransferase
MMNHAFSAQAAQAARRRWYSVAKPLDSLGLLEDMVVKLAGVQGTDRVDVGRRCCLTFCADNGVVAEGVTQTDSSVTAAVARSIARGTGNICQMARIARCDVFAVDVGMLEVVDEPGIISRRVAPGTKNIARGPAMTREECQKAIAAGSEMVGEMARRGYRLIATGEMGIGNTTTASAVACALTGAEVGKMTGRGAGLSDEGLQRKREAIARALEINQPVASDPLDVLAKVGGFDIAAMAGAFLGGAKYGVTVLVDGFISSVAALCAQRMLPESKDFMLATHVSREPAGAFMLEALGLKPVITAGMALGEGTGAVAAMPLIDMALAVYRGATFSDIAVEAYTEQGGKV